MEDRTTPARLLERLAAFLVVLHLALRLSAWAYQAPGVSALVHALPFLAAGTWFASRALAGGLEWRFTGAEWPLGLLVLLGLASAARPSVHPLASLEGALALGSVAVMIPLAANLLGPGRRGTWLAIFHAATFALAIAGLLQWIWILPAAAASPEARLFLASAGDLEAELRGRLGAGEPWATFFYPNTYAGFLVLAIPAAIGSALDLARISRPMAAFRAATAALAASALLATGSKGGWLAALVSVAAFLLIARYRNRGSGRVPVALALALLVGLVAAAPALARALAPRSESAAVRSVYWDAAVAAWKERPLAGVGLDNFEDHYPRLKDDRQEETRHVHNDYLQALAELGIPGLLGILGLLAGAGLAAIRRLEGPPAPAAEPWPRTLVAVALGLGVAGGAVLTGSLADPGGTPLPALLVGVAWIGGYLLTARHEEETAGPWSRVGLGAGLAGLAAHFAVDFAFHDAGVLAALGAAVAALALLAPSATTWKTGPAVPAIASVLVLGAALPVLYVAPRWMEADEAAIDADLLARKGELAAARERWDAASRANPLLARPWLESGLLRLEEWRRLADSGGPPGAGEDALEEEILVAFRNARKVRDDWGSAVAASARAQYLMSRRPGRERLHVQERLGGARHDALTAMKAYPTRASNRLLLGRVLEAQGDPEGAKAEFAEALRLCALAVRVSRLRLDPASQARALVGAGGDEAQAAALLQAALQGRPADWLASLRRRPERLDDYDPPLRPALDRALDALGVPR